MKKAVFYLGPPLSGKSTLAMATGAPRFSVRHWFEPRRAEWGLPPSGTLLPDEMVERAVEEFLTCHKDAHMVIFDGFPSTPSQLLWIRVRLAGERELELRYCQVSKETAQFRAKHRQICIQCDGGADPVISPPSGRCPVCGHILSRRPDDTEKGFAKRWKGYFEREYEMCKISDLLSHAVANTVPTGLRGDLHLHTTASDGAITPGEMIHQAAALGIGLCAVTDHDTVDGIAAAQAAAERLHMAFLRGTELSAVWQGKKIHLLGYGIDPDSSLLRSSMDKNRRLRLAYDLDIIDLLGNMLPHDARNNYMEYSYDRKRGGWKLLNFLIDHGLCDDGYAYFDLLWRLGSPPETYIPAQQAIEAIHRSGGVCVLAHPGVYGWSECQMRVSLEALLDLGLDGVECWHPLNNKLTSVFAREFCLRYHLLSTGGSDDHGNLPNRTMGQPIFFGGELESTPLWEKVIIR